MYHGSSHQVRSSGGWRFSIPCQTHSWAGLAILALLGDNDAAFAQFDKAIDMGWDAPAIFRGHRALAGLREDPRFADYLARIR